MLMMMLKGKAKLEVKKRGLKIFQKDDKYFYP